MSAELGVMDTGDRKEPEGAAIECHRETADEFQDALVRKSQRDTQLGWNYLFLSASVVGSWMLGQAGFSVAWVVLLLGLTFVVWHGSFIRLVEETVTFEKLRVHRRRALQNDETAEWVNFLINRWWIFSSPTIFTLVKTALDPLLNESKPAFVESVDLQEFELGDSTPCVTSIKAFDISSGIRKPLSPSSVGKPLFDLAQSLKCQLALEVDANLFCPEFRMVLRSRLGGKGVGMDLDIAMEKLSITGKLSVVLSLNMDSKFPHVTKATFAFMEKPEVWFNLRILKTVQMMEVPILKTWVHSLVMDALTTALVDPGKLDVNITPVDGFVPSHKSSNSLAQGVLTITLSRTQQQGTKMPSVNDEERWCVIRLGDQRQVTARAPSSSRWQECRSFLVENPATDNVCIKLKSKRIISTITLAQFEVPLSNYNLEGTKVVETVLQKKGPKGSSLGAPSINLRMEYTPLTSVGLENNTPISDIRLNGNNGGVAGVMYVCIHGADGLIAPDRRGIPNPYCIVFCNRKKVKTTHYICHSSNPKWESCVEFLVSDYLQMVISFAICSWDTNKMADSDLLGLGSLAMTLEEPVLMKQQIPLTFNAPTNIPDNKSYGVVTVSAVFRPVASVSESDSGNFLMPMATTLDDEETSTFKTKKNNPNNFMKNAKMLLTNTKEQEGAGSVNFADILSSGSGLMEMTVIRARDLVAKDLNGYSDPYCEVKINNDCKFKTSIKKKTLNPVWDEIVTTQLPKAGETLAVIVWDRDPLGMRDFLGSLTLTLDDIRQLSQKDSSDWFFLKDTKSGEIELKIKVISEDFESSDPENAPSEASEQIMGSPSGSPTVTNSQHEVPAVRVPPTNSSPALPRRLPIAVPSPVPPKRETPLKNVQTNGSDCDVKPATVSPPRVEITECPTIPAANKSTPSTPDFPTKNKHSQEETESQRSTESSQSQVAGKSNIPVRAAAEYSSIRSMKQKMKLGLSHPLRRFRSEASVHEPKAKNLRERVTVENRDGSIPTNDFDSLVQATSHPDISSLLTSPASEQKEIIPPPASKTRYYNLQGKVIQGLGFKAAQQCLIYCRVRLQRSSEKSSRSSSGKTVCKSSMVPASINPHFDAEFQIENPNGILKTAALVIDIRTDKKETIASKTLILQEAFGESLAVIAELQDWFSLSNGAKIELELSHGKAIEKKTGSRKLFRSWSVHKIGKI